MEFKLWMCSVHVIDISSRYMKHLSQTPHRRRHGVAACLSPWRVGHQYRHIKLLAQMPPCLSCARTLILFGAGSQRVFLLSNNSSHTLKVHQIDDFQKHCCSSRRAGFQCGLKLLCGTYNVCLHQMPAEKMLISAAELFQVQMSKFGP